MEEKILYSAHTEKLSIVVSHIDNKMRVNCYFKDSQNKPIDDPEQTEFRIYKKIIHLVTDIDNDYKEIESAGAANVMELSLPSESIPNAVCDRIRKTLQKAVRMYAPEETLSEDEINYKSAIKPLSKSNNHILYHGQTDKINVIAQTTSEERFKGNIIITLEYNGKSDMRHAVNILLDELQETYHDKIKIKKQGDFDDFNVRQIYFTPDNFINKEILKKITTKMIRALNKCIEEEGLEPLPPYPIKLYTEDLKISRQNINDHERN